MTFGCRIAGLRSVAFAAPLLTALPARADEGGLPQLDTNLYPEQLFWLAVSFGLLYVLMHFFALPGVARVQDKRRQIIDKDLDSARAANEQAKAMGHATDRTVAAARADANATIAAIKAEASQTASARQQAQHRQLTQRLREAESGIAATRDAALKDIEGAAAGLAAAIVENVAGLKVKA